MHGHLNVKYLKSGHLLSGHLFDKHSVYRVMYMSLPNWSTVHFSFTVPSMGDMIQRHYPFIRIRPFP